MLMQPWKTPHPHLEGHWRRSKNCLVGGHVWRVANMTFSWDLKTCSVMMVSVWCCDFSFIVYDAFEHWKTVIRLVCCCDDALHKRPLFFVKFMGKKFLIKSKFDRIQEYLPCSRLQSRTTVPRNSLHDMSYSNAISKHSLPFFNVGILYQLSNLSFLANLKMIENNDNEWTNIDMGRGWEFSSIYVQDCILPITWSATERERRVRVRVCRDWNIMKIYIFLN